MEHSLNIVGPTLPHCHTSLPSCYIEALAQLFWCKMMDLRVPHFFQTPLGCTVCLSLPYGILNQKSTDSYLTGIFRVGKPPPMDLQAEVPDPQKNVHPYIYQYSQYILVDSSGRFLSFWSISTCQIASSKLIPFIRITKTIVFQVGGPPIPSSQCLVLDRSWWLVGSHFDDSDTLRVQKKIYIYKYIYRVRNT